jgi:hypothetical protein
VRLHDLGVHGPSRSAKARFCVGVKAAGASSVRDGTSDRHVDFDSDQYAENLRDDRPRLMRPDAVVEVEDSDGGTPLMCFLAFDRTRRVDKNYEKFRRYDCFLNYWWRYTDFGAPWVIFICQERGHAIQFLDAADRELDRGHLKAVERRRRRSAPDRGLPRAQRLRGQSPRLAGSLAPAAGVGDEEGERRVTRTWLPGRPPEPRRAAAGSGKVYQTAHRRCTLLTW